MTSAWHELGDRRAVLLVQLRPDHERDDARLDYFLGRLPDWMRVAVEFRHPSWHDEEVFALLERHGAAYCVMSGAAPAVRAAGDRAVRLRAACTAPTTEHLYAGSYSDDDLRWWADRDPGVGAAAATTSSSTSTTTATATPSATPQRLRELVGA